jgi:hypothetical protein
MKLVERRITLGSGEGHEYRPFPDLRSVPEAEITGRKSRKGLEKGMSTGSSLRSKISKGPALRSFSYVKQRWDFSTFQK